MEKKGKNYWPHFIIALVFFAIALGVWTIKTAIDNPVEMDNTYMLNYHKVDEDINEILKKQIEFEKRFVIELKNKKLKKGKNRLEIVLKDNSGKIINNAKVEILVTRPETTKLDKKISPIFKDGYYIANFDLEKEGRWNIVLKVKIGNYEGFKTYKLSTLD